MIQVDIVLTYYNGSKHISEQLDSILQSDLTGIKLNFIIVDDNSSNAESDFLKALIPPRSIYIKNTENLGVISSIQKGIEKSSSEYVFLSDQDDVWSTNKIKLSIEEAQKEKNHGPILVYTDLAIVDKDLKVIHLSMKAKHKFRDTNLAQSLLYRNFVTGCSILINRSLIQKALPFPKDITMHDHWLALVAAYTGKISFINVAGVFYRQHGSNQVGSRKKNLCSKLINFELFLKNFELDLYLKAKMAEEIFKRTSDQRALDFKNAIDDRNFFYLISNDIIGYPLLKKLEHLFLLCLIHKPVTEKYNHSNQFNKSPK